MNEPEPYPQSQIIAMAMIAATLLSGEDWAEICNPRYGEQALRIAWGLIGGAKKILNEGRK